MTILKCAALAFAERRKGRVRVRHAHDIRILITRSNADIDVFRGEGPVARRADGGDWNSEKERGGRKRVLRREGDADV